ncbi:nuclear transport factor 2 family protein [Rhizobium sp. TRM95111]|uniref:nuclear transport factor 2 family protein n=1 Tax=Rhizobium alarense TaxID=2846851 RepID=UPI001F298035|nr:nuclear transport factor 2 family protein [Rhizobium alarense]MCF3641842.1 nuclear transport factor 2 family protein [Rhizobium alarense]
MADITDRSLAFVEALNRRDYEQIAALVDEDVAIDGFGSGMDNGRGALRARLAGHFSMHDERYGDALVLSADGEGVTVVRLTVRGETASGPASHERLLLLEWDGERVARLALFGRAGA